MQRLSKVEQARYRATASGVMEARISSINTDDITWGSMWWPSLSTCEPDQPEKNLPDVS